MPSERNQATPCGEVERQETPEGGAAGLRRARFRGCVGMTSLSMDRLLHNAEKCVPKIGSIQVLLEANSQRMYSAVPASRPGALLEPVSTRCVFELAMSFTSPPESLPFYLSIMLRVFLCMKSIPCGRKPRAQDFKELSRGKTIHTSQTCALMLSGRACFEFVAGLCSVSRLSYKHAPDKMRKCLG